MAVEDAPYTARELMVATAAKSIGTDDTVFVGMRLPMLSYQVAVETHAPNALAVFEAGIVRDDPADGFIYTMGDLPNISGSVSATGLLDVMNRLQRGDVDVGFIGGAEIDRYGNLNTTRVDAGDRQIRLPGSGGACDIASLAGKTVIIMPHEPRRFVESVTYNTSPGYGNGGDWRQENGLPGGGPDILVTSKATFGFDDSGELFLDTVHPGVSVDDIHQGIPWELRTSEDLGESIGTTPDPSGEALSAIRKFDPDGFWTG